MSSEHLGTDRRGVAPLVGFILLLGILVTALAVYQVTFVPTQNAEVEFKHSQDVSGDLEELRAATLDTGTVTEHSRDRSSVRVRLGTQYPARLVAVNPPPAEGHLRTTEATLRIDDAEPAERLRGDAASLFGVDHDTRLFVYEPGYTETQNPPVTYLEHSLLYNREGGANVTLADQRLVQNASKTINVVLLEGGFDRQGMTGTVDLVTLDMPDEVEPDQNDEVELEGTATSVGDGEDNRTGTPLQNVTARIDGEDDQVLFAVDPDESNRTIDFETEELVIDTAGFDPGEYETTIRAQDASGLWSERDIDTITIVVEN